MESEQKSLPYIPGLNDPETRRPIAIPEPEAKHIISEADPLIVLEYAERISRSEAAVIKEELKRQGVNHCLILDGGAHLGVVSPKTGDVLVLKTNQLLASETQVALAERLKVTLEQCGIDCQVLIAEKYMDVSLIDETTMRRLGWVRAPKDGD